MAKNEYSSYQKDVISRYYENQETILLQNLQELVTELYLADTDAKRKSSGTKFIKRWSNSRLRLPSSSIL